MDLEARDIIQKIDKSDITILKAMANPTNLIKKVHFI